MRRAQLLHVQSIKKKIGSVIAGCVAVLTGSYILYKGIPLTK